MIGTESTVRGGAYQRAITALRPGASVVAQACPLFVSLAEEGWIDGEIPRAIASTYLEPLVRAAAPPDCLVLGCTHFPVLAEAIRVEEASIGPPPAGAPPGGQWFASEQERAEAAATKLKAVADQYPSTEAGKLARYQEASVYLILGRPKEAAAAFQQVIDLDTGLLGQSARLGLAEAHAQAGEYDQAIERLQRAYIASGHPDHLHFHRFEGGHQWSGAAAKPLLAIHLKA